MPVAESLKEACGEIADLARAASVLGWDQQTYMPPRGAGSRGRQLATLSSLIHERITSPRLGELMAKAEEDGDLSEDGRAFLRELDFKRSRLLKLPPSLVREMTLEQSAAFETWVRARKEKDFALFAPRLSRLLELSRQKAECLGYEETPWDALVPDFEPGTTASQLRPILDPLREATKAFLARIERVPAPDTSFLAGEWPIGQQREFGLRVARDIGFDFEAGRQDIAAHPFCTSFGPGDVRITTRYDESDPAEALLATIHECGHALYNQGFRPEDDRTPLAGAPSHGIHESQSRFWEIVVAHSAPFWRRYLPIMREHFPGRLDGVTADQFLLAINRVRPSLIRVGADEVTYNLHIAVRFDVEVRLLAGELAVEDIPAEWNRQYKELLGLDVPDDAQGCLQDVHWSHAAFGYFPSYTLGNIYGAMIAEKMEEDLPGMWEEVEAGRFAALLEWLREHVHREGKRLRPVPLVRKVTGKDPSAEALLRHFDRKYGGLFGI